MGRGRVAYKWLAGWEGGGGLIIYCKFTVLAQNSAAKCYKPKKWNCQVYQTNKTLRSVHFGVVVVELIKCKCGGIAKNEIW